MNVHIVPMSEERRARLVRLGFARSRAPQAALKPVPAVPVATSGLLPVLAPYEPPTWLINALAKPAVPEPVIFLQAPRRAPKGSEILRAVARFYGLSVVDLRSQRRSLEVITARHVGIYLAREMTELSLPQIGGVFGDRDHTTILHAVKRIRARMKIEPGLAGDIRHLRDRLGGVA